MLVARRRGTGAWLELAHLGGAWDHALLGTEAGGGVGLQSGTGPSRGIGQSSARCG